MGILVDLHCHILPGIDDGAHDLADSLIMAEAAVADGIHTIVATPHYQKQIYENNKQLILTKVEELNNAIKTAGIDIEILPGQEPRIDGDLVANLDEGEVITLANSPYLFVEFPSSHVPRYTEQLFYGLRLKGFIPIIVHPERNQELIENPEILYQFVEKGALTQVTAASITGDFGKKIKQFSKQLMECNLTHFIASDAHNTTTRRFRLKEAYVTISEWFGNDLMFMYKENAQLLVQGKSIYKELPERIKKKRVFKFF